MSISDDMNYIWAELNERYREPIEISVAKFEAADGEEEAKAGLEAYGIDPAKIPFKVKLVGITASRDFDLQMPDANGKTIYGYNKLGASREWLAFPIIGDGKTIDIAIVNVADGGFETVRQKADWLGADNIGGPVIRLHPSPLQWLAAGCSGCCSVNAFQRQHLNDLQKVEKIHCNDIATALEAWEWGFAAGQADLARFEIDASADSIDAYFQARAAEKALSAKHRGRFNLVMA